MADNTATLSPREMQVAELMAWGATKKDIANKLIISERTVENHARAIYEKTGVTKVNELSAWFFCTKFHIPLTLSPLKKTLPAMVMLAIILPHEIKPQHDAYRLNRCQQTVGRAVRARRRIVVSDNLFDYELS